MGLIRVNQSLLHVCYAAPKAGKTLLEPEQYWTYSPAGNLFWKLGLILMSHSCVLNLNMCFQLSKLWRPSANWRKAGVVWRKVSKILVNCVGSRSSNPIYLPKEQHPQLDCILSKILRVWWIAISKTLCNASKEKFNNRCQASEGQILYIAHVFQYAWNCRASGWGQQLGGDIFPALKVLDLTLNPIKEPSSLAPLRKIQHLQMVFHLHKTT